MPTNNTDTDKPPLFGEKEQNREPLPLKAPSRMFSFFRHKQSARASKQHIPGIRFRIIEGTVALLCLLLFDQIFWLFMRAPRWESLAGPRSGVYMEGWSSFQQIFRSWDSSDTEVSVRDPWIRIRAFVPAGTLAGVFVNGTIKRTGEGGWFPLTTDLRLRRGSNGLAVVLANGRSQYQFSSYPWWLLSTGGRFTQASYLVVAVQYHPADPLKPKIFGVFPTREGICAVIGSGEPDTPLLIREPGNGVDGNLRVDRTGLFSYSFRKPTQETSLTVSSPTGQSSASVTVQAGCPAIDTNTVPLSRMLMFRFTEQKIEMHLSAHVPSGTAFYEWIRNQEISTGELLGDLFGLSTQDQVSDWTFAKSEDATGLAITIDKTLNSIPVLYDYQAVPVLLTQNDELKIEGADRVQIETDEPSALTEGNTIVWTGRNELGGLGKFLIVPRNSDQNDETEKGSTHPAPSGVGSLVVLEKNIPEFIQRVLWMLLTALPFIWLLMILGRDPYGHLPRYGSTVYAAAISFLFFHLTVLSQPLFYSSLAIFEGLPFNRWLARRFGEDADQYSTALHEVLRNLGRIYPFLIIAACFLIKPIFRAYNGKTSAVSGEGTGLRLLRWLVFWPLAILLPAPLLAGLFAYYVAIEPSWRETAVAHAFVAHYGVLQVAYAAIALLVFWFYLYWPLRSSLRIRIKLKSVLAAALAMLMLPLAAPLMDLAVRIGRQQLFARYEYYAPFVSGDLRDVIARGVIVIVGAFALYQLSYVEARLWENKRLLRWFSSSKRYIVFSALVLFCIPVGVKASDFGDTSALFELTWDFDNLLPYLLVVGCILLIRHLGASSKFDFPRSEILQVGALLFAFFLAGRTSNLLFIPIPLLLGWWMFRKFAIQKEKVFESLKKPSEQIQSFLHYKRTIPVVEDLVSTVENKLRKADISVTDYKSKVSEAEKMRKELDDSVGDGADSISNLIFGCGPGASPWENAATAMRYGLIISAPFQVLSLMRFQEDAGQPYVHLQWIALLMFNLSFWAILSFLFGYFFHVLRGRDGLQKGLVLFTAVVVPTIPQRLLGQQPLFQGAHLVQIFEILAFLLVLGLFVFDLRSLMRHGYQWRDLITAHGLTALTGYATSVVVTTIVSLAGPALKAGISGLLNKVGIQAKP